MDIKKLLAAAILSVSFAANAGEPAKPLAIIGFGACGHWVGAVIVDTDGIAHGVPDNWTPADAQKVADTLPEHHSIMAMAPCVSKGVDTSDTSI